MLNIDDLSFADKGDVIKVNLYGFFFVDIPKEKIEKEIGKFKVDGKEVVSEKYSPERVAKKLMRLLTGYKSHLTYSLNKNRAVFVDEDLGLPLMGLQFIGVVDKGSEMIEIKPITNCNAGCSFCSVSEGCNSNKEVDFVVDKDYLVNETKALLEFKGTKEMSMWINPHGEPTLYFKLVELVDDLLQDEHVKDVHVITNGVLLSKNLVDEFAEISDKNGKKVVISISISAIDEEKSKQLMGINYDINLVLKNIEYAAKKLSVAITPVLLHGLNDDEMEKIISFAKKLKLDVGIQKFCENKRGKNPVKEQKWDDFFDELKKLEEKSGFKLTSELGKLQKTKQLDPICKKGDNVHVKIICPGRYIKDRLGVLENSQGRRAVSLVRCSKESGVVKAIVVKNKYNIAMVKGSD